MGKVVVSARFAAKRAKAFDLVLAWRAEKNSGRQGYQRKLTGRVPDSPPLLALRSLGCLTRMSSPVPMDRDASLKHDGDF